MLGGWSVTSTDFVGSMLNIYLLICRRAERLKLRLSCWHFESYHYAFIDLVQGGAWNFFVCLRDNEVPLWTCNSKSLLLLGDRWKYICSWVLNLPSRPLFLGVYCDRILLYFFFVLTLDGSGYIKSIIIVKLYSNLVCVHDFSSCFVTGSR